MNEAAPPTAELQATRIGRVVSVSGSQLITLMDQHIGGDDENPASRKPDIGEVVNVRTTTTTAFGLVTGLSIPIPEQLEGRAELRIMELELIGEIESDGIFRRGVSVFPGLGDEVHHTTREDLRRVFMRAGDNGVRIGVVNQDKSIPACVMVDELLGKHFAVLGTTGTGKSCAVAVILRNILAAHSKAHIVILDQHNEFATAFGDTAEQISPADLQLPYWLLNFEEMKQLIIGDASGTPEIDSVILHQVIVQAKRNLLAGARHHFDRHRRYAGALSTLGSDPAARRSHGQARPAGRFRALSADPRAVPEPAIRPPLLLHVPRRQPCATTWRPSCRACSAFRCATSRSPSSTPPASHPKC